MSAVVISTVLLLIAYCSTNMWVL